MAQVLIVEDEPEVLALWRRALSQDGHVVFIALRFDDAERVLVSENIDVLVTGLMMPEPNGLELIMLARAIRPRIRIVAVSGRSQDAVMLSEATGSGADATLAKPVRLHALRSIVARLCAA